MSSWRSSSRRMTRRSISSRRCFAGRSASKAWCPASWARPSGTWASRPFSMRSSITCRARSTRAPSRVTIPGPDSLLAFDVEPGSAARRPRLQDGSLPDGRSHLRAALLGHPDGRRGALQPSSGQDRARGPSLPDARRLSRAHREGRGGHDRRLHGTQAERDRGHGLHEAACDRLRGDDLREAGHLNGHRARDERRQGQARRGPRDHPEGGSHVPFGDGPGDGRDDHLGHGRASSRGHLHTHPR